MFIARFLLCLENEFPTQFRYFCFCFNFGKTELSNKYPTTAAMVEPTKIPSLEYVL